MCPLTTTVERLSESKVRLHVAVPAADFERALDATFHKLAGEVKIPGFRPGKAPRRLLEARFGVEAAREQALRDSLPLYYADAVAAEDLDTIAPPEIDLTAGVDDGDVEFDAVVEVRPVVTLRGYDDLRVEIERPVVADDAVDHQIDALRERFADLEDSTGPLIDGSYAEIDIKGYVHDEVVDALTATDFLYEVGSGLVVPELDVELRGTRPGDILKFTGRLPERFGERAGEEVAFQVLVKATKRKVLPDVTDEWVSEASEFDTVDALRADVRARLELLATVEAQMVVRDRVLDAVAALVEVEIPEALVSREIEHRLHDLAHRLEHQGATLAQYIEATGQDEQALVASLRQGAEQAVRADLALRAVVAQEGIEVLDEEIDHEVAALAERLGEQVATVRRDVERRGALEAVRFDLARGKALRRLVDHATVVDRHGDPVELVLPAGEPTASQSSEPSPPQAEPEETTA